MTELVIDEVIPKRSNYPILVSFQNAYISDNFPDSECSVCFNKQNNSKTVITAIDDLLYSGEEENDDLGKKLLLVRDRTTGKVRLIEPGLVELKPVIENKMTAAELLDTSALELSRKFGSKKSKMQMEQKAKLKMNVETVTQQVEKTTANVSMDQLDISAYRYNADSEDFYIPPINRAATSVEDVYDVDKILTKEDVEKIETEIEDKALEEEILPSLKPIFEKTTKPINKILCLYASCLGRFYKDTVLNINKKSYAACKISHTLHNIIIQNFTTAGKDKRGRPAEYKDKAFCHILVFLLLINNYKIGIDTLCSIFNITPRTIIDKSRVTGATITQGKEKVLHLRLPLATKSMKSRRKSSL